jgi:hypothetical protein
MVAVVGILICFVVVVGIVIVACVFAGKIVRRVMRKKRGSIKNLEREVVDDSMMLMASK